MAAKKTIFLSHSGRRSSEFAEYLNSILPDVFNITCWFSKFGKNLASGADLLPEIQSASQEAAMCISIIDRENAMRPWILLEPGMFIGQGKPTLFLCCGGLTHNDLYKVGHPISTRMLTDPGQKDSIERLFETISTETYRTKNGKLSAASEKNAERDFRNAMRVQDEIIGKYREIYPAEAHDLDDLISQQKLLDDLFY